MLDCIFVNRFGFQKEVEDIILWGIEKFFVEEGFVNVEYFQRDKLDEGKVLLDKF